MSQECDFATHIDEDEGLDVREQCALCDYTEAVGEPELVKCCECEGLLCPDHVIMDGYDPMCPSCYRARPDPEDNDSAAYDPNDARDVGHGEPR